MKDTVKQIWSFDAFLHNFMQQAIGTLNGTTITGSKVFVTDIEATQGTGTVSIINADGTGDFTAPNQPYFNYNQIVAAGANSLAKLWKVSVPNTVTAVNMDILMSTDFPAEQTVTATPPDSEPQWFGDDSSWTGPTQTGYLKGVVTLCFTDSATLQDRQLAVAYAGGTVVGGAPVDGGDGCYYMKAPNASVSTDTAINRLQSLPQVDGVSPTVHLSPGYLRPHDGANWTTWSLSPDSIGQEVNWALEAIDAPYAWGCSTGDSKTNVSVIDHVFDDAELSSNVASGANVLGAFTGDTIEHGTMISALVAARGNDDIGITGVMWRAGLRLVELGKTPRTLADYGRLIAQEANAGSKIVNLSYWFDWEGNQKRVPSTHADSDTTFRMFHTFMKQIRKAKGSLPLIVTIAGDSTIDAFWSVLPILHDSLPARSLIVAGSTLQRKHLQVKDGFNSGSGDGRLVDLYAPGGNVGTEQLRNGQLSQRLADGTSFSAPFVAGTAGLLLSFDPRLSPDSLRTLLLDGATQANRSITDPSGQVHYLLDAYASLKLAAQRPGSPICGNRVWANDSAIVVQRDTAPEVLDPVGHLSTDSAVAILEVEHGGKTIGACLFQSPDFSQLSCAPVLVFGAAGWTATSGSLYQPNGGAALSFEGRSHEASALDSAAADTNVAIAPIGGVRTRWSITRSVAGGTPSQLAEVDISVAPPQDNFVEYNAMVAYPPRGANIIVATTKLVQAAANGPFFDTTWVYTLAKAGGTASTLMILPNVQFDGGFSISENGSEVVVPVLTSSQACFYQSYSLAVSAPPGGRLLMSHPVSDPELCDAFPTVAPDRVTAAGKRRVARMR